MENAQKEWERKREILFNIIKGKKVFDVKLKWEISLYKSPII